MILNTNSINMNKDQDLIFEAYTKSLTEDWQKGTSKAPKGKSFDMSRIVFCIYFFFQTASHVKARHQLLQGAIGVFPEEKQAYETISILSWILPLIAFIGFLMDTILVVVYMRLAHPWKDILFGQMEQTEETQPIELDIQEVQSNNQVIFLLLFTKEYVIVRSSLGIT